MIENKTDKASYKILFSGHDFKFLAPIIGHYENAAGYEVILEKHEGHKITNTRKCKKYLEQADIVFCEWCLGNAEWYSKNIKERHILIIRLHHQEMGLPYLSKIKWDNVDRIIFVSEENRRQFIQVFPGMSERAALIHNAVDCTAFDINKRPDSAFNIGMMGFVPKRKSPHMAMDILKRLKTYDERFMLFFKGKHPEEYDWCWNQAAERKYYEEFYDGIKRSGYAGSIIFDPFGRDVPDWFSKIGFILSTSDHEGSHQSVAEGMASGAIPVIRNWAGADLIYPEKYIFKSLDEAVDMILKRNRDTNFKEIEAVKAYAREKFDRPLILARYDRLLSDVIKERGENAR